MVYCMKKSAEGASFLAGMAVQPLESTGLTAKEGLGIIVEKSGKSHLWIGAKSCEGTGRLRKKEAGRENGRICRLAEKSGRDV